MAKFEGIGFAVGEYGGTDIAKNIFGGENTIQTQMKVEAAMARAQASIGMIPQEAADEITKKCDVSLIDEAQYFEQLKTTGHPLVGLVRMYGSICDNNLGQYVHYGTTTQDIIDTARMLLLKQATEVILEKAKKLRAVVAEKAMEYKDTIMIGRTNDQQAMPLTVGFMIASWADGLDRDIERIESCMDRVFVGQFFGAVGTLASMGEAGVTVGNKMMEDLGLGIAPIQWSGCRDRLAEIVCNLSILTANLGRIGAEFYGSMRNEVGEITEGFKKGMVGSSTMPHKRNPFVCGKLTGLGRQIRSCTLDVLTIMENTSIRDSRNLFIEDEVFAKPFLITDAALDTALKLVSNMAVHEDNIERNMNLLNGLVFAEALMMRLAKDFGRLEAHEMVYELAQEALSDGKSFKELLFANETITAKVSKEELESIMNPAGYIGLSAYFTEKVCGK